MLNKRLGIDLGTSRTRIYFEGRGVVLEEPTVVAMDETRGAIVAFGEKARVMLGRAPSGIKPLKPLLAGAVCDYQATESLLAYLLRRILGPFLFIKPEVMITTAIGTTQVERRALVDAMLSAGGKSVYLIEQPLAAAIGAKIPIAAASGTMLVQLGAGCSETVVISTGGIVASGSVKIGGERIDKIIASYLKRKHNLAVGEITAEKVKNQLALAVPDTTRAPPAMEIDGQDIVTGLPKTIMSTSDEISGAITKPLQEIVLCIKKVFEITPPEVSADIINHGIFISGGLAHLKNLSKLIMQATGVACHVAQNPERCAALGAGQAMENLEEFEKLIVQK